MLKTQRFMAAILCFSLMICALFGAEETNSSQDTEKKPSRQIANTFTKAVLVQFTYEYLTALPPDYEQKEKWPLVLFLHGSGECGSNLSKVKANGPPKIAETTPYPFILISPQSPEDHWDTHGLNALLDEVVSKYKVDIDRVYVTGLSLGGGATWAMCAAYPERFAAAVPVCGWNPNPKTAELIKNIPFWVFHGEADKTVPIQHSKRMVDALKKAGADPKFTTYPGVDHASWVKAYAEPELWTWLLSQKRGVK